MKTALSCKSTLTTAAAVVLALWVGYAAGYRRGVHTEAASWFATAHFDSLRNEIYSRPPGQFGYDPVYSVDNPIPNRFSK
jgi:hypothetical protein